MSPAASRVTPQGFKSGADVAGILSPPLTAGGRQRSAKWLLPVSTYMPKGSSRFACNADPLENEFPPSATVVMAPVVGFTARIRPLLVSEMYNVPLEATATPTGELRAADMAAAPSPLKPNFPIPATVAITP